MDYIDLNVQYMLSIQNVEIWNHHNYSQLNSAKALVRMLLPQNSLHLPCKYSINGLCAKCSVRIPSVYSVCWSNISSTKTSFLLCNANFLFVEIVATRGKHHPLLSFSFFSASRNRCVFCRMTYFSSCGKSLIG